MPPAPGTRTLTETRNGSAWKVVKSLNPGKGFDELLGVSCFSAADCVAVGEQGAVGDATLAESWNGLSWNAPPSPASGPVGTAVTITGLHLPGATKVTFNGTAARPASR